MKFNLLSGILLVLLLITGVWAYFQKVEADAQRQMAVENEAKALVLKAEADAATAEARRQAQIAMEEVRRCMESKK